MAAAKGNQYAKKDAPLELRKECYRQFCQHLASGMKKESFYFEHPQLMVTHRTVEKWPDENPEDFPPEHRDVAFNKGYQYWENIASSSATGENEKANTASLQMVLRNKYGWDKREESTTTQDEKAALDRFARAIAAEREKLHQERNADHNATQTPSAHSQATLDKSE